MNELDEFRPANPFTTFKNRWYGLRGRLICRPQEESLLKLRYIFTCRVYEEMPKCGGTNHEPGTPQCRKPNVMHFLHPAEGVQVMEWR